jgi:hypothetical protein
MTLKTSLVVGLAAAALVVGVQTASAAPTSNASDGTSLVRPDFGQNFLYPGGYPQSGHGYLGNPPASASAVGSGSEIGWPQLLGVGFGVGMAVLLGLILTVRIGRSHPVAH